MSKVAWLRLWICVGAIVILELLCRIGVIGRFNFLPPSEIVGDLVALLASGQLTGAIVRTLSAVAIAFIAAVIVGVVAGVVLQSLPWIRRGIDPFLTAYYAVPIFAFYPLFIVLFGLSSIPEILIGFLYAVVAVLTNTLNGLERVPRVLRSTARVYRMGRWETAIRVTLPSAAPYILTGVKLATAYAFTGVIGAEFIMAPSGLGYQIAYAYNNFDNSTMYPLILLVLVVATIINFILYNVGKRRSGGREATYD
jgi:NitT/TauT family transport system permease protein